MSQAAHSIPPFASVDPRLVSEVLRGYGPAGIVEVWLVNTPGGPFALVVVTGEDALRDERARRRLAVVGVHRATFVPAEVGVVVPQGVRAVPDPPPDNSDAAAEARGHAYLRDKSGVTRVSSPGPCGASCTRSHRSRRRSSSAR